MRKVLVTGGAGYIGSHACKALARAGFLPVTLDNLSAGHRAAVKWGPLVRADITDSEAVADALAVHAPVAIMHFAALSDVAGGEREPEHFTRINVEGTRILTEAAMHAGVAHFVFSSSCSVYGQPDRQPINEATPTAPVNHYGATKLAGETVLAQAGLQGWYSLRYFNAAGADPDGEAGEAHEPETHLIPRCLMAANGEIDALMLNGDDWPTADGTPVRDYIHVTDLARFHVAALRDLLAGGASGAVNLGTGTGLSVRQIIEAVERVTGRRVPYRTGPRRKGDPPALVADAGLAASRLGLAAEHSDLDTIIRTAWAWHRKWTDHGEAAFAVRTENPAGRTQPAG